MITLEPPRGVPEGAEGWRALALSRVGLARFAKRAREAVGLRGEVDILLAPDTRLRQLNREYRGKDKATDVLSFSASVEVAEEHAGDLAISVQTAARQAREHGHTLKSEVCVLLLHGMLHLHGMDHETDSGEMATREAELRAALRLPNGLIARASVAAQNLKSTAARPRRSASEAHTKSAKRRAAR